MADPRVRLFLAVAARQFARVGAKAMYAAVDEVLSEAQGLADEAGGRVRKARKRVQEKIAPRRKPTKKSDPFDGVPEAEIVGDDEE